MKYHIPWIQYSFYFHMPQLELHNCRRDIHFSASMGMHEYTRSPQDYWSKINSFFVCVFITYFVDIWERPTCFESYKCTLFMSVHVEKKKKGWQCNISDLAPYYAHVFTLCQFSSSSKSMIWKLKSHILWNCFMGCAKVWRRSPKCLCLSFSFPPPSVIATVCQNFPITVCGINLSQQTVSLLAILQ